YTVKKRDQLQRMLGLKEIYFSIFEEELDRRGLPMELKYIPVIESALNTHAQSRVGATGLWQIMYPTAKELGLRIDTYVDERRNPRYATSAGLDYMERLYSIYGDWLLVIAAYNCGPGNVNKAMRRSGGKKGIWEIFPYLPRETRGYVPAFISAVYAFNYYEEHQITPWESKFDYTLSDTIMVDENVRFDFLASELGMTVDELRYHNPELKRDFIPGKSGAYPLRLPFDKAMAMMEQKADIELKAASFAAPVAVEASERGSSGSNSYYFDKTGYTRTEYEVKSGDNLGFISEWYGVSLSSLKNWNNLYSNRIRVGQKLAIYKKDGVVSRFTAVDGMTFEQKQGMIGKAATASSSTSKSSSEGSTEITRLTGEYRWHTVKSGDSLWSIARSNSGNTVDGIAKLNGISTRTTLKLGQKLKLNK
ncbi:MAG: membrane-bound lytic murein transglycosylase D, partial [Limisphaerales bacterium]